MLWNPIASKMCFPPEYSTHGRVWVAMKRPMVSDHGLIESTFSPAVIVTLDAFKSRVITYVMWSPIDPLRTFGFFFIIVDWCTWSRNCYRTWGPTYGGLLSARMCMWHRLCLSKLQIHYYRWKLGACRAPVLMFTQAPHPVIDWLVLILRNKSLVMKIVYLPDDTSM